MRDATTLLRHQNSRIRVLPRACLSSVRPRLFRRLFFVSVTFARSTVARANESNDRARFFSLSLSLIGLARKVMSFLSRRVTVCIRRERVYRCDARKFWGSRGFAFGGRALGGWRWISFRFVLYLSFLTGCYFFWVSTPLQRREDIFTREKELVLYWRKGECIFFFCRCRLERNRLRRTHAEVHNSGEEKRLRAFTQGSFQLLVSTFKTNKQTKIRV